MFESSISNEIINLIKSKGYNLDSNKNLNSIEYFSSIDDEIFSLYYGVGLRINTNSSVIELTGKDCVDFLHRITTNSILYIRENEFVKTIFTNEKGRIIGVADVLKFEDKLWLKTDTYFKDRIIAWINRYIISDDVNVKDIFQDYASIYFYGPQVNTFLEWVFNSASLKIQPETFQKITFDDFEIFISYQGFKAIDGSSVNIILSANQIPKLLNHILDNKGPFELNIIGKLAYEAFRIEQGYLIAENELNDNFNPHELNISELIDTRKGCYIGQEVLARLETYDKVQKRITGLELSSDFELFGIKEIVNPDDEIAGYLTSKTYSYKLKNYIGLGLIRNKYLSSEEEIFIKENNEKIKVKIHNLPFIQTKR